MSQVNVTAKIYGEKRRTANGRVQAKAVIISRSQLRVLLYTRRQRSGCRNPHEARCTVSVESRMPSQG